MAKERTESLGHFEMLYDCEHCGTKGLLAKSQRHCAECGAPQNPDKRYFPKEGEEKVVDGHRFEGSDRHCPSCNTAMGAIAKNCTQCGAPLDGSKEVRGVVTPVAKKKPRRWWLVALVIGIVVLIIFGIWYRFIRKVEKQLVVTGHRWERSIAVEEYADVDEEKWRDQMPTDARGPICQRKERSRKQVPTGEEDCKVEKVDKKDGTFEQVKKCTPIYKSEPVEDDWCRYSVRTWKQLAPVKLSGAGLSAAWPTKDLPPAEAAATLGARRQGKRTETFTLEIATQSCEVSEAVWRKYADGATVKVQVRASSGAIVCSSL